MNIPHVPGATCVEKVTGPVTKLESPGPQMACTYAAYVVEEFTAN